MATEKIMAVQANKAHKRAAEVVEQHGSEERRENLKLFGGPPPVNNQIRVAAYQAEMIAALAEIVEEQASKKSKKAS